ncbi:hypothetical protein NMG60_11035092 [Bertholletia excelsa]
MGNHVSLSASTSTGRVIFSDGTVQEYSDPLTAAELMLDHPQQVVVEFNAAMAEKRPSPLPADKKLEVGKVYVMLPMRGKTAAFSSEQARQLLSVANSLLSSSSFLASTTGFVPLFARICTGNRAGQRVVLSRKDNSTARFKEGTKLDEELPEVLEQRPEYLSRQFSGKGWKPSLDTIKENIVIKKGAHWLF